MDKPYLTEPFQLLPGGGSKKNNYRHGSQCIIRVHLCSCSILLFSEDQWTNNIVNWQGIKVLLQGFSLPGGWEESPSSCKFAYFSLPGKITPPQETPSPNKAFPPLPHNYSHVITQYKLHFSRNHCCFIIFFLTSRLTSYDVQYLQNVVFSITKGLNVQKNSLSNSSYVPGNFPYLENPDVSVSGQGQVVQEWSEFKIFSLQVSKSMILESKCQLTAEMLLKTRFLMYSSKEQLLNRMPQTSYFHVITHVKFITSAICSKNTNFFLAGL